jgi:hypothetical protein
MGLTGKFGQVMPVGDWADAVDKASAHPRVTTEKEVFMILVGSCC